MDEKHKINTIFRLAKEGNALFFDAGVISGDTDLSYRDTLAIAKKFKELESPTLAVMRNNLADLGRVCADKSREVYTIPDVITESEDFRRRMNRKFDELELQLIAEATCKYTRGKRERFREIIKYHTKILDMLSRCYFKVPSQSAPIFNHLENLVSNVGEKIGIKNKPEQNPRSRHYDTDSKLVASALYHSVVNGRSSDILCKDGDIGKLLYGSVASMILKGTYGGVNGSFSKSPVRVFYCAGRDFQQECDSSEVARNLGK